MAERVDTPIKSCHECWANYTLAEWDKLQEVEHQDGDIDRRECGKCGAELDLDRSGLDDLDLTDDPAAYEAAHPDADRVTADMIAPLRVAHAPTEPPTPKRSPELVEQIVRVSLRRTAPQIAHGVAQWINRCPREADAYTLAELRALLARGPL